jgi:hypothetical protein
LAHRPRLPLRAGGTVGGSTAKGPVTQPPSLAVQVECYAGHRGEETPRRFSFGGRSIEVVEILDAWFAPEHRYFKLRGDDGARYILRNDVTAGRWELTMFDRTSTKG